MIRLQLFKIRVRIPSQESYLYPEKTPAEALCAAVMSRPSIELRAGYTWHLGNVAEVGDSGLYFAFGRTTSSIVEMWDEGMGEFVEVEFETAPYTHVVLDLQHQVAAIAAKSKLAPTPKSIANYLRKVLAESGHAKAAGIEFEVSALSDPRDFIFHLQTAYAVRSFTMSFSRPNPIDTEELFHKPMERLLQEARGVTGETKLEGEDLDRSALEALTRSVAASGDGAKARVQVAEGTKPELKRLTDDAITITEEELDSKEQFQALLARIAEIYTDIRESDEGRGQK